jgi:hypothetical protein
MQLLPLRKLLAPVSGAQREQKKVNIVHYAPAPEAEQFIPAQS